MTIDDILGGADLHALVVARLTELGANKMAARRWYNEQALASFDGKTAFQLVREGRFEAVLEEIDRVASGGHV